MNLTNESINKIEQMEIKNNRAKIIFSEREAGEEIANLLLDNSNYFIKSKKIIWQPLVFQELTSQEAKIYAKKLKKKLIQNQFNVNFFTNIRFYE
jgi:hypothetical protein